MSGVEFAIVYDLFLGGFLTLSNKTFFITFQTEIMICI